MTKLKEAFKISIPIMTGYLFLGTAFGIYVHSSGFPLHIALLMSIFIYAGSMQFATIPLLMNPISIIQVIILTLSINARHLFYGLSMIKPFEKETKRKPYMIFSLTDESFSLLIDYLDRPDLMYWILLMNQGYWVLGTLFGYVFGSLLPFATHGIEFSMTALFIVTFLNKLKEKQYRPMAIGLLCSVTSLFVFGSTSFVIPSMIGIVVLLLLNEKETIA